MSEQGTALRRVVYISRARHDMAGDDADMLRSILDASRRNNTRRGVTGALLYSDRLFAQVLEGPPGAVEEVFEVIQCDPRHDSVSVLEVSSPGERAFGDWSMAYVARPETMPADLAVPGASQRLVGILQAAIRNTEAAAAA